MSDIDKEGLMKLKKRAFILSAAYQAGRDRFTFSNMFTLVLPAILSTVVAIGVADDKQTWFSIGSIPIESILAGLAAILVTIHKVLNCEEYQAECLRLSNLFKSIAQDAEISIHSSRNLSDELNRLSDKMTIGIESSKATVPKKYMIKARQYAIDENGTLAP